MVAAGLIETLEIQDGVRRYTVIRPKVRYPDLPVSRLGVALEVADLAPVLAGLPAEERRAATTLLKQGLGRWRRWSTILRRPPRQVDVRLAERELVPVLLRAGALAVRERYDAADGRWRLDAFRTDDVHAEALGRPDPDRLAAALTAELTHSAPRAALAAGRPPSLSLEAFAFVLRAADRWLELRDHGRRTQDRELAALVWHSKAFTPVRARHVAEIVGVAPGELFEPRPRQLICDGPLLHPNATIWADAVHDLPLEPTDDLRGIVCIENSRTFEALRTYAKAGWLLIHVPGNAPSAEVVLLSRAAALSPRTPALAAFDPDPAGIRIALSLARRSDVPLDPLLMGADALRHATKLPLADWDREELVRLFGRSVGPHRPLLDEIERFDAKGEQEAIHGWLRTRLDALTSGASAPPAAAGPPAAS